MPTVEPVFQLLTHVGDGSGQRKNAEVSGFAFGGCAVGADHPFVRNHYPGGIVTRF